MKISLSLLTVFKFFSLVSADKRWGNGTVWTTEIVTAYTTYCPSPTTVVQNNQTYTVTSATLLTITNCPCTLSTIVPTENSVPVRPTASSTPTTAAVGGGGGGSATTSEAPSSTTSAVVQSSNAGAVTGSFFAAVIAVGIMAGLT